MNYIPCSGVQDGVPALPCTKPRHQLTQGLRDLWCISMQQNSCFSLLSLSRGLLEMQWLWDPSGVGQFAYSPIPGSKEFLHQLKPLTWVVRNGCEHHHSQFGVFPYVVLSYLMKNKKKKKKDVHGNKSKWSPYNLNNRKTLEVKWGWTEFILYHHTPGYNRKGLYGSGVL